jgi:hypothetical protein
MTSAATMEQAPALAASEVGSDLGVLIVPHVLPTLPTIQGDVDD